MNTVLSYIISMYCDYRIYFKMFTLLSPFGSNLCHVGKNFGSQIKIRSYSHSKIQTVCVIEHQSLNNNCELAYKMAKVVCINLINHNLGNVFVDKYTARSKWSGTKIRSNMIVQDLILASACFEFYKSTGIYQIQNGMG